MKSQKVYYSTFWLFDSSYFSTFRKSQSTRFSFRLVELDFAYSPPRASSRASFLPKPPHFLANHRPQTEPTSPLEMVVKRLSISETCFPVHERWFSGLGMGQKPFRICYLLNSSTKMLICRLNPCCWWWHIYCWWLNPFWIPMTCSFGWLTPSSVPEFRCLNPHFFLDLLLFKWYYPNHTC